MSVRTAGSSRQASPADGRSGPSPPPAARRDADRVAELAALLVATQERREACAARIGTLAATVDQEGLADLLNRQRVLPLAGQRLVELCAPAVTDGFAARLNLAVALARRRASGFMLLTAHLAGALQAAGVRSIPLKGTTLAVELYGDAAQREHRDIDILVAPEELDRAAAVIAELGWRDGARNGERRPRLHKVLRDPNVALPEVELHWRIHWYETRFTGALLARSRVVDDLRRLDPLDQLAALLLFYARDGFAGLRLAADIAAWWDRYGGTDVPAELSSRLAPHPALVEPCRAALSAATRVAGLPPAITMTFRPAARRSALAIRLTNWGLRGDAAQIHANVTLVDGLLAPRWQVAAFVRRRVLPTPSTLPAARSLPEGAGIRRSTLVLSHAGKTLARYLIALWTIRGGRSWCPPV